jgi:hypothetical protein
MHPMRILFYTIFFCLAIPQIVHAKIYISGVLPIPETDEPEQIELSSTAPMNNSLTDWELHDETGLIYSLSETIAPNQSLTISLTRAKLNNSGDTVFLYNAQDELIDQFEYGTIDYPTPDKNTWIRRTTKEPSTQTNSEPINYASTFIISSIHPNPEQDAEFIIIKNISEETQSLDGWSIIDRNGSITTLSGDVAALSQETISPINGNLNNNGDKISLYDPKEELQDQFEYSSAPKGTYWINETNRPYALTSPEQATQELDSTIESKKVLSISELFPNPAGPDTANEFFELCHQGTEPLQLSGWSITNIAKQRFVFSAQIIQPGDCQAWYRNTTQFRLHNSYEEVRLFDPTSHEIDSFGYQEDAPEDHSWQRIHERMSWTSAPTPGEHNRIGSFEQAPIILITAQTKNDSTILDASDSYDPDQDSLIFNWKCTNKTEDKAIISITPKNLPCTVHVSDGRHTTTQEYLAPPDTSAYTRLKLHYDNTTDTWSIFNQHTNTLSLNDIELSINGAPQTLETSTIAPKSFVPFTLPNAEVHNKISLYRHNTQLDLAWYRIYPEHIGFIKTGNVWQAHTYKPSNKKPENTTNNNPEKQQEQAAITTIGSITAAPHTINSQHAYIQTKEGIPIQLYSYYKVFPALKVGDEIAIERPAEEIQGILRIKIQEPEEIQLLAEHAPLQIIELNDPEDLALGSLVQANGVLTKKTTKKLTIQLSNQNEVDVYPGILSKESFASLELSENVSISIMGILLNKSGQKIIMIRSIDDLVPEVTPSTVDIRATSTEHIAPTTMLTKTLPSKNSLRNQIIFACMLVLSIGIIIFKYKKTQQA